MTRRYLTALTLVAVVAGVAFSAVDALPLKVDAQNPDVAREPGAKTSEGAVVVEVMPGSAARSAGLWLGDIIVAINEVPVRDAPRLRNKVGLIRIDETVWLRIDLAGERGTLSAKIGARAQG
jgi:S1-C subfamily serine protease